uniref:Uncharacterized protein n=1 Tax=Anopheles culicifacies TaxID=139723 RepID=A0A182MSP9_9DIPT
MLLGQVWCALLSIIRICTLALLIFAHLAHGRGRLARCWGGQMRVNHLGLHAYEPKRETTPRVCTVRVRVALDRHRHRGGIDAKAFRLTSTTSTTNQQLSRKQRLLFFFVFTVCLTPAQDPGGPPGGPHCYTVVEMCYVTKRPIMTTAPQPQCQICARKFDHGDKRSKRLLSIGPTTGTKTTVEILAGARGQHQKT